MINFDIVYKKNVEFDSIKLLGDSQLRQLKLMICGKYQIYDYTHIFIYYGGGKVTSNDNTKLKDIFKAKKVKIEITDKEKNNNDNMNNILISKNTCFCGGSPEYICEKCEEYLCNFCLKKKKHITHDKNIIKISEYSSYIKKNLKDFASELDNKILNDEAYKFLKYWDYDKDKEIKAINNLYEYIKGQIEDIKQLEIDNIINLSEGNKYNELKLRIENTLNDYTTFNLELEIGQILEQKKILIQNSKDVVSFYNSIKIELLKYTKAIKEFQLFNQEFMKFIQNKFNIIKRKFTGNNNFNSMNTSSYNLFNTSINNENIYYDENGSNQKELSNNSTMRYINHNLNNSDFIINVNAAEKFRSKSKNKIEIKKDNNLKEKTKTPNLLSANKNKSNREIDQENNKEFENFYNNFLNSSLIKNSNKRNIQSNSLTSSPTDKNLKSRPKYTSLRGLSGKISNNNILLKLKDKRKILIFNLKTQIFKEKIYFDKSNFRKELSSEKDVIQLNLNNNLYMLSGKESNKFYYYNTNTNSVIYINNSINSHYYGVMLYCNKNNNIYLLGGNSQKRCEILHFSLNSQEFPEKRNKKKWRPIPSLNEERQEFGAMIYNDDFLYVFFGFSHKRGVNLNSIERMNINTHDSFETVFVNEHITLSSIGCALIEDDNEGGILLLGGFDGEKYIETSLIFCPDQMKIRECDIIIPNISKHFQFLFHKETNFIKTDNNLQVVFDMKNNVHVLTNHSYELFSEVE